MKLLNSKYYIQFSAQEIKNGYKFMFSELVNQKTNQNLINVFFLAWEDFKAGKFAYDGATFVNERCKTTLFEVPAFIHDWRNANGYVGKKIDNEMFSIMTYLNYNPHHFIVRARWVFFTWINVLRHKYYLKDLKNTMPKNLIIIS